LKNHGVVLGDTSLQNAFYKIELLKAYVEIYFGAEVLGGAKAISKKGVNEIKNLYRK
jgi:ribulose-5-phosphate 4-epimerase/fuculose-1-phosphate aldolase